MTRGLLLAVLATSTAHADTDSSQPPGGPPPSGSSAPSGSPATPAPGDSATPAPADSATPATVVAPDVETKAKVDANKKAVDDSKVTGLVMPSPSDHSRPAFQLEPVFDIPVIGIDIVFRFARLAKKQKAYCAPLCDQAGLNSLDKLTAGYWVPAWSTASDVGLWALRLGSGAVLLIDEGARNGINDIIVVGEATLTASAVSLTMTLAAGRPRPYVYGDPANPDAIKAPLSKRNSSDAGLSFLSGHTTESFAFATSLYMAEKRLHPHSKAPLIILGTGLGVATFVGLARVMSGYHFITDVIGGAVVGSAVGVMVPALHKSPVSVVPMVTSTQAGLGIQGNF